MTMDVLAGMRELLGQASRHIARNGRCAHCGRPLGWGVEQCRPVPSGWYCWADGLIYDPDRLIAPTPDPVGEAEKAVIDRYAPQLAAAAKDVDEALAVYTSAEQQAHRALMRAVEAGVTPAQVGVLMPLPPGNSRQADDAERRKLVWAAEQAQAAKSAAAERLRAARVRLHALEARCDHERRAARNSTEGEAA